MGNTEVNIAEQIESNIEDERTQKKADAFIKISERRVTAALNQISLIGNLANKSSYAYTEEQVKEIIEILRSEVNVLEEKFTASNEKRKKSFSFSKDTN